MTSIIFTVKMTDMSIHRILLKPKKSFFLFGPRGTGKSTWLKKQIQTDLIIDLLKNKDFHRFSTRPELLAEIVEGNPSYKTIVIDEIQKLPSLLDEVHALIFDHDSRIQFILTGSSARKLKKSNVNLLAGRALVRHFYPLSFSETKDVFNLENCLKFGMLPEIFSFETEAEKKDYLDSYVQTYLKEEIQQESLVRSLPSYLKFLEHFALRNAQVINLQNLSQEIGIPRTTISGYLDILQDTLLGLKLEPLHLKAKVKEVSLSKFYFFDTGVVRALSQSLDSDISADESGFLFETYILHELKCYSDYFQKRWQFNYWGTPSENEVDFVISSGKSIWGLEVKSSKKWTKDFNSGLNVLLAAGKIKKAIGIYTGQDVIKSGEVMVYPVRQFIEKLFSGKFDE